MYGYIYKTTNLINGKIYVGKKKSSVFLGETYLGSGKYLNNAVNKYGKDNFKVELIEWCNTLDEQNIKEKYWIQKFLEFGYSMYNISKGGDGGNTFWKANSTDVSMRLNKLKNNSHFVNCSPEILSISHKKGWETRRANGNDKFTEEQKFRMSIAHKGKKLSKNVIKKIVEARKGYTHSEETRKKIAIANTGKKLTEEVKLHISQAKKGKGCGIDNSFYGKKHSDETKQLIGSYNKKRFENKLWINNGEINKRVNKSDLSLYLTQGYILGRMKLCRKP